MLSLVDPEATVVRRRTELLGQPEPAVARTEEVTSAAALVAALHAADQIAGDRRGDRCPSRWLRLAKPSRARSDRMPVRAAASFAARSAAAPRASRVSFSDGSSSTRSSRRSRITPISRPGGMPRMRMTSLPSIARSVTLQRGVLRRDRRRCARRSSPSSVSGSSPKPRPGDVALAQREQRRRAPRRRRRGGRSGARCRRSSRARRRTCGARPSPTTRSRSAFDELQPAADRVGHVGADVLVLEEAVLAGRALARLARARLADVVQQRAQAHDRRRPSRRRRRRPACAR